MDLSETAHSRSFGSPAKTLTQTSTCPLSSLSNRFCGGVPGLKLKMVPFSSDLAIAPASGVAPEGKQVARVEFAQRRE